MGPAHHRLRRCRLGAGARCVNISERGTDPRSPDWRRGVGVRPGCRGDAGGQIQLRSDSGEFKGVRTYAQQIKHVAAVNYVVFAAIAGEKPPADTGGESGPDSVKTKAEIIKYLKDSFAYAHKVAAGITKESTTDMVQSPFGSNKVSKLGLAAIGISHPFDHYGQMVVYLRMNGIIPPASRAQ